MEYNEKPGVKQFPQEDMNASFLMQPNDHSKLMSKDG